MDTIFSGVVNRTSPDFAKFDAALSYDPDTGEIRWKRTVGRAQQGAIAGSITRIGRFSYRTIQVAGKRTYAHRIAWLLAHGFWPAALIDHKNRNTLDNRLTNLREATPSQNSANCKRHSRKSRGVKGVYWNSANRKWVSYIRRDGKSRYIGSFSNIDDAARAYEQAAKALFGEFARTG